MKSFTVLSLLGFASTGLAFPALADDVADRMAEKLGKRQAVPGLPGGFTAPSLIPPGFDAKKQYISTTGKYKFVPPGPNDQRGVCPGLNALANHNYLPHNGVATIQQFIDATTKVYGMSVDLATFLAVYGAIFDGDLTSWSIGGPANQGLPLNLLTQPRGLSGSHNKYEGDASPTRGDLYLFNNAWDARPEQWEQMYALQSNVSNDKADYNLEVLTPFRYARNLDSRARNPYFFNGVFSGLLVQPAAYTFIWRFMSNKSQEYPEGRLDQETLKSFFAFEGTPGNFKYNKGHERIPDNWYRRAFGDEYSIPFFIEDVALAAKTYPIFLQVGGNTGKTNTFTGVDPKDVSKGVYNLESLKNGNQLFCYALQVLNQQAPDFLFNAIKNVGDAVGKLNKATGDALKSLGCPQLAGINTGPFQKYPGFTNLKGDGTY